MHDEPLGHALSALGHPTRLGLLRLLLSYGPAGSGPTALAEAYGLPRNLVSYHLKPLLAAGLVRSERRGRDVNYTAEQEQLGETALALHRLALLRG